MLFALFFVAACHDTADPPVVVPSAATSASAASAPPEAASRESRVGTEKTPETCAAAAAGKPHFAHRMWTVVENNCVCNGCLADTDCTAKPGGACTTLGAAKERMPPAKVCLYPGDDCFGGAACPKGRSCVHDGIGRATGCSSRGDFKPN